MEREIDVPLFSLTLVAHHVDLITGLELGLAVVVHDLGNGGHAFRLGPNIHHNVGRSELDHRAFQHMVVTFEFFALSSEALERGSEVISRGLLLVALG